MVVEQKAIMVWNGTFDYFKTVKVEYQAKIKKELTDNEFTQELLECLVNQEKLTV